MSFRVASAWALLLALATSLAIAPLGTRGASFSEDRNLDGQPDVWHYYDEDGELVRVLQDRNFDGYVDTREVFDDNRVVSRVLDQNFDHRFDPSFAVSVPAEPAPTLSVALQPFLLPRAMFVGDHLIDDPAPVTCDRSAECHCPANPSGRAPPATV